MVKYGTCPNCCAENTRFDSIHIAGMLQCNTCGDLVMTLEITEVIRPTELQNQTLSDFDLFLERLGWRLRNALDRFNPSLRG